MPSQPVFDHFLDRLTTSFFECFSASLNRSIDEGMTQLLSVDAARSRSATSNSCLNTNHNLDSLAKFAAIRGASSFVSSLAAERRPGSSSK
jgi:hypothetical protein